MSAGVGIAGAIIAAGSHIGGMLADRPDEINVTYPAASEMEQRISKYQLEAARGLREKIDDPRILEDIYRMLPETKMSEADRAAFTNEFAHIKQQVATVGLNQAGQAMGQKLDDMVARGAMSQDEADRQRLKNEAAINAVMSIYNKKLDAARIGMARGQYLKNAQAGLQVGSAIQQVDQANRSIYNAVISQALQNLERRQAGQLGVQMGVEKANLANDMNTGEILNTFQSTIMQGLIPYGDKSGGGGGGGMGGGMSFGSFGGGGGHGDAPWGQYIQSR